MPGPGVLANDTVPCSSPTITVVTQPQHGSVSVSNDGSFSYVPTGAPVSDQFVYDITCPDGQTSRGTVSLPAPPGVSFHACQSL